MTALIKRWWLQLMGNEKRILVVDPQEETHVLLKTQLAGGGWRFQMAMSADEALEVADSHKKPHVIISNYQLGGITSGVQLARTLSERQETASIPIIILHPSMGVESLKALRKRAPRADFVTRPYTAPHLRERILAALMTAAATPGPLLPSSSSGRRRASVFAPPETTRHPKQERR